MSNNLKILAVTKQREKEKQTKELDERNRIITRAAASERERQADNISWSN